jgi:8-oxo-dGTP pyrophosphatase MutT (NUDIX family)
MSSYGNITDFILKTGSFEALAPKEKVRQVYGIILNSEGKMLVVYHQRGEYLLPGGSLDNGETFIECLKRECLEEANMTLKADTIKEAFYQACVNEGELICYQLRYTALVDKELGFVVDPDVSIIDHKWINIEDLPEYLKWGNSVVEIQKYANKALNLTHK